MSEPAPSAVPEPSPVPGLWPVPDVLAHLAGAWQVVRTAHDLATGTEGRFSGTAVFGPLEPGDPAEGGGGLLHRESGTFEWQGVVRPAERTLRWLPGPAGTARVEFADGRFFHDLDLRTGTCTTDHPCAADLYRGTFTAHGPGHWRTRWRVRGPAKDLLLVTDHLRPAARPGRAPAGADEPHPPGHTHGVEAHGPMRDPGQEGTGTREV